MHIIVFAQDAAVKQASSSDEVAPATDDYNPFSEDAKPKAEAAQDVSLCLCVCCEM